MNFERQNHQRKSCFASASILRRCLRLALLGVSVAGVMLLTGAAYAEPYSYTGTLQFDIHRVPFSRFGSYLSISDTSTYQPPFRQDGIYLRTLHHGGVSAFRLELLEDGEPVAMKVSATPTLLTLTGGAASVQISFQGPERLRIHGAHAQLRFIAEGGWAVSYPLQRWQVNTGSMKYMFWPLNGTIDEKKLTMPDNGHVPSVTFGASLHGDSFDAEVDAFTSAWPQHVVEGSFQEVQQKERDAYRQWLAKMPTVDSEFGPGAELAAYVNWESVVSANGNLKRPAMLMSKNWMGSIWSWDHTFNAMALASGDPGLAWDQFLLPIDAQDEEGSFPDKWDADTVAWEFSKPPVHGWALSWMMRNGRLQDREHLTQVYEPLARWTEWYFHYRDSNANGIPEYSHGNESGWDNDTVLQDGGPVESPDLSAYLVLQMQTLSTIANRLGKNAEAEQWQKRSAELQQKLLERFWDGHEFVAYRTTDGHVIHSQSLLLLMPIILGKQLPAPIQKQLVADVRSRMQTSPFGLPSEPPSSPFYKADGYWLGPIWAPSTMIVAEGLDDMGEHDLANELRRKFCLMAQRSGMAENFDPMSGAALRDPAYTWTSSVYLIFAAQLEKSSVTAPSINN